MNAMVELDSRTMSDALARLNAWHAAVKGRQCVLQISTTYGATCWECELEDVNRRRRVIASEVWFFADGEDGRLHRTRVEDGWRIEYVAAAEHGWCGPDRVVDLAIDTWAEMVDSNED